jgi:hypothetical protein
LAVLHDFLISVYTTDDESGVALRSEAYK